MIYVMENVDGHVTLNYVKIYRFGWMYIVSQFQELVGRHALKFSKKPAVTHLQVRAVVHVWEALKTLMLA